MVQWKDYNVENATWESKDNVIESFEEEHRMKIQSLDSMSISGPEKVLNRQTAKKSVYCGNCQMPFSLLLQGRHGEFEPGKVQYSTTNFFDLLFLIRSNVLKPKI